MGYRIQYGQTLQRIEVNELPPKNKNKWIPIALMLGCVIAALLIFSEAAFLRDLILPGNANITEAALVNLAEDVRNGVAFRNAITAFCREIIINASIPW